MLSIKKFIMANILFALLGGLSIFLALSAFMLFDAPGAANNTLVWLLFWASLSLPILCFAAVIASLVIGLRYANYKKALYIFLLPCLDLSIILTTVILVEIFCDGSFACH